MIKDFYIIILALSVVALTGCTSGEEDKPVDHVWKEQADTIDRARDAARDLEESAGKKRKEIEQQLQ